MSYLSPPVANWISYIFLFISFLILCGAFWILRRSRKLLAVELEIAENRFLWKKKTQPVAIGYENWYKEIGT
ncbi:hypothetical protein M0R72_00485 [Candidatus Pacearchaeota archaeon]|jgi:hypothetical protein|nr:hypothetical protein [Candidatus Pacearchaeota archaeon]